MRKIVNLNKSIDGIKRLMIYNDEFGTYLFGFKKIMDCGSDWDEWYESEKDAIESCESRYGVRLTEWKVIPDPQPNCQHDWIHPVRIKNREKGKPEFGKFEKLVDGEWIDFKPNE